LSDCANGAACITVSVEADRKGGSQQNGKTGKLEIQQNWKIGNSTKVEILKN